MSTTQLYVIGDGNAAFWTGNAPQLKNQMLPGIATSVLAPGFDAAAFAAALPRDRSARVLVCTAFEDCAGEVLRTAQQASFLQAVDHVVDMHFHRLMDLAAKHANIAVWGPLAASERDCKGLHVGTVIERNFALLMFTQRLRERLAASGILLLSLLETMIASDGTTIESMFDSNGSLNQASMPPALDLVRTILGIDVEASNEVVAFHERRLNAFASIGRVQKFGVEWTEFEISGEVRYITEATIAREVFAPLVKITVATTIDDSSYPSGSYEFHGPADDPKSVITIPIGQYAKKIMFNAEMGFLGEREVNIFERVSRLQAFGTYRKSSLLALRNQLLGKHSISVVSEDVAPRKNKIARK